VKTRKGLSRNSPCGDDVAIRFVTRSYRFWRGFWLGGSWGSFGMSQAYSQNRDAGQSEDQHPKGDVKARGKWPLKKQGVEVQEKYGYQKGIKRPSRVHVHILTLCEGLSFSFVGWLGFLTNFLNLSLYRFLSDVLIPFITPRRLHFQKGVGSKRAHETRLFASEVVFTSRMVTSRLFLFSIFSADLF